MFNKSLSGVRNPCRRSEICICNSSLFLPSLRDWVVERGLYTYPTACVEPERLADKLWSEVRDSDSSNGKFQCLLGDSSTFSHYP